MIRLLLAFIALVGLIWLAGWLGKATPAQRSKALKLILLYGVAGILLLLVVTGRIHWMFAALSAAVPWLQRAMMARQAWRLFKSARGPGTAQASSDKGMVSVTTNSSREEPPKFSNARPDSTGWVQ